ncbi:MAG: ECF-type sigma factor [Acidobacteriota bacterium]
MAKAALVKGEGATLETSGKGDITRLLGAWSGGDADALEQLAAAVYPRLSRLASKYLRVERSGHTLDTGALVHEAFLLLFRQERVQWRDRSHFFAISAKLMRRILVDHARSSASSKRGGGIPKVALEDLHDQGPQRSPDLLALDAALHDLEAQDADLANLVVMRYFGGLTKDEIAELLGTSPSTVARRWRMARAWLFDYLAEGARED